MASSKFNPVFWLMWMIPGAAVLAGLSMVAIAMQEADRALPDIYHWEGERLDADFERARNAARHGVAATVDLADGACTVTLRRAPAEPASLQLRFTSSSDARLDRVLTLPREGAVYRAPCESLPTGRWRLALQDDTGTWYLRAQTEAFTHLELRARDPEGR